MTNTNINNIVKYAIFTGLWAVLLIPFYVANTMFFPYIVGKNFAFRIIIEIIFALWVYLAFIDVKYRPKCSIVLRTTIIFTAIMFLADILAVAPVKAFWSNFERMDGWITLIHLLMYLLVFGSVMKTEKLWLWFFRSSLAMSVVMILFVTKEWLSTGATRVSVTLGNPIYVAILFLFNFFFALILLYKDVIILKTNSLRPWLEIFKSWLTYVYLIIAFLCVFGIWRTSTRGVILGLLGGLFVSALMIAIFEKKDKIMRKVAIGGVVAIVVIIVGFFAIKNTEFVKNNATLSRLAAISWQNVNGQGQARQYVWPMAFQGVKEKPILGWGQDGFNYVFNKYYDPRMYAQEQWFDRAHNMPIDILVAGGILGLISYLSIFVAALWLIWKRRERLGITDAALLVGVLAGYFFQNLFVFDNLISYILFFVVLAYLHSSDTENDTEKDNGKNYHINQELINYIVAPLLVVILGVSFWYLNYKPISANLNLIRALQPLEGGLSVNLDLFKKILSSESVGTPEIREQLLSVVPRIVSINVDQKIKQDFVELAYNEIQKQVAETPNDARYQFFAGQFLANLGQYQESLQYFQKAVELSPTKLTMLSDLSKTLAYVGDKKQALEVAKRAYDLMPEYVDVKIGYIFALIINGDEKAAKDLLGATTTTDERIVRAYLINASDYLRKGDKWSAVAEVEKAIKISPNFEAQGRGVIDGIWKGEIKE
ncbi:MAG: O-antigen ligase family protein [Candidatus Paceibacterota bacterium]|jgi:O-antigen ligase